MITNTDVKVVRPDLRLRFNSKVSKASFYVILPLLIFVLLQFFRQGVIGMLVIFGIVIAILLVGFLWLRLGHEVILGSDYVQVKWGLSSKTFRRVPDLAVVRLSQVYASVLTTVDPLTGWLFLGEGKKRATIAYVNSKDQAKILETLGNPVPYEAIALPDGRLAEKPTANFAAALPLWIRRPMLFATYFAIVILVVVSVLAVFIIKHENNVYRQSATDRLNQAAVRYTDPNWQPTSAPKTYWSDGTDHSSLGYSRTFNVPYKTNQEFIAGWNKLTGARSSIEDPLCESTHKDYFSCYGHAHAYIDGKYITVMGYYSYSVADSVQYKTSPQIELTIEDTRD